MNDKLFEDIEQFINTNKAMKDLPLYTDEEYEFILLAFAEGRGDKGFREEEADKLLAWCDSIKLSSTLISLILKGVALIGWDGEQPMFQISELGKRVLDAKER